MNNNKRKKRKKQDEKGNPHGVERLSYRLPEMVRKEKQGAHADCRGGSVIHGETPQPQAEKPGGHEHGVPYPEGDKAAHNKCENAVFIKVTVYHDDSSAGKQIGEELRLYCPFADASAQQIGEVVAYDCSGVSSGKDGKQHRGVSLANQRARDDYEVFRNGDVQPGKQQGNKRDKRVVFDVLANSRKYFKHFVKPTLLSGLSIQYIRCRSLPIVSDTC